MSEGEASYTGPTTRWRHLLKAGSQVWVPNHGGLRVVTQEPELYARTLELRPRGKYATTVPWTDVYIVEGWI